MSLLSRLRRLIARPPAAPLKPAGPMSETIDFNDPAVARDPYRHWEALRALGPVHHLPASGGWMVLGFDAIKEAFARPDAFSNAAYGRVDAVLLGEDPPRQAATRRLVSPHFTPRAIGRLEKVACHAARAALRPRFDAVRGFAQPVSRAVAKQLIGYDDATFAEIEAVADAAVGEVMAVLIAGLEPFSPRAAIYQRLLRDGEGVITEAEARSLVRLLWLASITTTERVIVRCLHCLVGNPALQQRIRADRALIEPFVEEVMRLHPPEHVLPRIASADAELGGKIIPAGAAVFLCVGAANRDPSQFEAPAELRLERGSKRHLAFGSGIHHCVGAPLARRVIAAALGELFGYSPELRAAEPLDALPWFATLNALSPTRMEVEA